MTGVLANIGAERFYCEAIQLQLGRGLGPTAIELLGWPAPRYFLETRARRYQLQRLAAVGSLLACA